MTGTRRVRRITPAMLERAIGIIGTVAENIDLSGTERDHFAVVIHILERESEQGGTPIDTRPAAER